MRATKKDVGYYGKIASYYYQDDDYDTGDTYVLTSNYVLTGVMCSHNSPQVQIYDLAGTSWRVVDNASGGQFKCNSINEMCMGFVPSEGGTTSLGTCRISAPSVDNTVLTLNAIYSIQTSV
jgi:hypothetical protein